MKFSSGHPDVTTNEKTRKTNYSVNRVTAASQIFFASSLSIPAMISMRRPFMRASQAIASTRGLS